MENKDQGGIKRSKEKPLRIKKLITTEDGSAICEKRLKQTAMCDPDNTRQTSNGESTKENQRLHMHHRSGTSSEEKRRGEGFI